MESIMEGRNAMKTENKESPKDFWRTLFAMKSLKWLASITVVGLIGLGCLYANGYQRTIQISSIPVPGRKERMMANLKKRKDQWDEITRNNGNQVRKHRAPDVIGIGVRKCGTGALKGFLRNHPLLRVNEEMHYYDKNHQKGFEYYKNSLLDATDSEMILEKTPAYFVTLPYDLPKIIKRDSPNVKIILILCDPVGRAFSDYVMRLVRKNPKVVGRDFHQYLEEYFTPVKQMFQNLSLQDGPEKLESLIHSRLNKNPMSSFSFGVYSYFLRRWMDEFPPSNLHIVNGERFLHDPGTVIEQLQDFIGVPKLLHRGDFAINPKTGLYCMRPWWNYTYNSRENWLDETAWRTNLLCTVENKGRTRSRNSKYTLFEKDERILRKFYAPYNKILYEMIGKNFHW